MKKFKDELLYLMCILYIYIFSDRSFLHDRNLPLNGISKIETKTEQLNTKQKQNLYSFGLIVMWFTVLYGNSIFLHAFHQHTTSQ